MKTISSCGTKSTKSPRSSSFVAVETSRNYDLCASLYSSFANFSKTSFSNMSSGRMPV